MEIYDKYFNRDYYNEVQTSPTDLESLLAKDMLFISGDFYGIQKFIFENLATKNAAKVLRAKSAFIQLFTLYVAKYICHRLQISEESILSVNAGKFEILASKREETLISDIQAEVDKYFIDTFFGLSGVSIVSLKCEKEDFTTKVRYRKLRESISELIEDKKFNKFHLKSNPHIVLDTKVPENNQALCKICNMRKVMDNTDEKRCKICDTFIKLGSKLASNTIDELISNSELGFQLGDFDTELVLDKKIKSYILKDVQKSTAIPFDELSNNSCQDLDTGFKGLAVLKADVDNMGAFLRSTSTDITDRFENFEIFSKTLDNFFSLFIPKLMKEKYPNTYTVFGGGDDLFVIGAWDEVVELAREIHKEFLLFINKKLTISFGIAIVKPSYPVNRIAEFTEELLDEAKSLDTEKNAISLFGEVVKWNQYLQSFEKLQKAFSIVKKDDEKSAFLYRLLEIVEMAIKVKYHHSIEDTIWKSKLAYSFGRNMDKDYFPLLQILNEEIETNPKETKIFLCEYIYKRRES